MKEYDKRKNLNFLFGSVPFLGTLMMKGEVWFKKYGKSITNGRSMGEVSLE